MIHGEHQTAFVMLALAAAMLGAWVALDLQEQARAREGRARIPLLAAAGFALGISIFVTHFMAMLGFSAASGLGYDTGWTAVSLLLALAGSSLAIAVAQRRPARAWRTFAAAFVMGAAICAMHYAGMAAITGAAIVYDPGFVALSFVIAVAASWTALQFGTRRRSISARAAGSLLLALAISGMHFAGMAAARFRALPAAGEGPGRFDATSLSLFVGAGSFILLFLALIASGAARAHERQRLTRLQGELNRAARIAGMGAVATTLAHELNQPLTAAANYTFLVKLGLEKEAPAAEMQEWVGKAEEQIRRAGEIIRKARAMISESGVARSRVDLRLSLDRCLELLRSDTSLHEPDLRIEFDRGHRLVLGDPVQIEQVLANILRNGWQALAGQRQPKLTIRAQQAKEGFVLLTLSDNGPGLPQEDPEELFSALKGGSGNGLGVGLSIARTIIEAHGGKLWAENNIGPGATFFITLPAAIAAPVEPASPLAPAGEPIILTERQ
ncbi:sensor histidine kinase [Allosphingosinicella deserti]|uniref:sensor histidine kinase n=1 Tax=Allosphingosinicella deserti TaxID=2116704 RepID=UPI001304AFE3|nr:MHYT domain-containing protein [Sphingomonas deserti]